MGKTRAQVMTKHELISRIAREACITRAAAKTSIDILYEIIHETIVQDKCLPIPNVGTITSLIRLPGRRINPNTKEFIITKERKFAKIRSKFRE